MRWHASNWNVPPVKKSTGKLTLENVANGFSGVTVPSSDVIYLQGQPHSESLSS